MKRKLSQEEYEFIAGFMKSFSKDSHKFFDLIREGFDNKFLTKLASIAINHMYYLNIPIQDQCEIDIGFEDSNKIFKDLDGFLTSGYYIQKDVRL
jgi:hypothetical protein